MASGIVICGANGSGKTTLGRELAKSLCYKHMDIEDYCFIESEIPYTKQRTRDEVQQLILNDIKKYDRFVLSAVNGDMGEEINSMYCCAVYISAPLEIRIDRIKRRSYERFGERVCLGGDMYEQEQKFFDFAVSRSMEETEKWLKTLSCPVIYLDGTKSVSDNAEWLISNFSTVWSNNV